MKHPQLRGLIVSVVTPFADDFSVNYDALGRHVEWLVGQGVHGLLLGATAGEYASLSDDERLGIARRAVAAVSGRVPVIAYTGHINRTQMLALARRFEQAGADAVMLAPPLVVGPTQDEIEAYVRDVASDVSIGVVVYNQPGRTGIVIEPATMIRLSAVPNIVAMKESGKNLEATTDVINGAHEGFAVLAGEADLFLASLALGVSGGILTPSNFVPRLTLNIYEAFQRGDLPQARRWNAKLFGLLHVLRGDRKYHSAVKAAMRELGMAVGLPRPPLTDVSSGLKQRIKVYLTEQGLVPEGVVLSHA
jgi:4-hydroxy-tetrahydrodipicolinate synthase